MTKTLVGIDLGTTYSLVSVLQDGQPVLLPNALGELLTPSAVSLDGDEVLVGAPARARAATHPTQTALAFKRDMGTDRRLTLGKRTMTPVELSAMVLASLKHDAEAALGVPIDEAVITVPAYFGEQQRQATRDAGAIAGLRVERIINEPTAAALAYGLHQKDRELCAVVLDLGGGTFDVTVLEIIEGVIEIQSSAGDARLGGEDFSDALAAWVQVELEKAHGPLTETVSKARLREACERAKRTLTHEDRATIALPAFVIGGREVDVERVLSRGDAEKAWEPLLERLRGPILRALRDAKRTPDAIDEVLLVGGATRMPVVVQLAAKLFGRMPRRDLPTDEVVAMGAAVQAALKAGDEAVEDLVVTDVAPFTLGIAVAERVGVRVVDGLFSPILERGTVIPASRVHRYHTMEADQTQIDVRVYQGEHSLCEDNTLLGNFKLKGLPRKAAGDVAIDVRFTYDLNGLLEVEMRVVGSDRVESIVIEDRPGRLSKGEIEKARKAMAALKFHPRESLPNRTALARADALFAELRGPAREELGVYLTQFRAALETQETEVIDAAREQLVAVVAGLR
ncbi:MAG: Hsp70 family protein [Sandaracinus sp.]|nr:Hsp70 family protein [Sandaracinus sp.]MCB9620567.1 Hsp70 family protein [Sandaracinus sp.]MCB9624861.1 Hsp70 family protein [Sandaracinus sp.]MCB9636659.1 Hsp70 family protein [Sandaracinus sp.]